MNLKNVISDIKKIFEEPQELTTERIKLQDANTEATEKGVSPDIEIGGKQLRVKDEGGAGRQVEYINKI